jgi:two-component system response regulator AtoC
MAQRASHQYAFEDPGPPESILFGKSETMAAVRRNLLKVADTNIPILIEGESGTGKELICRYLHQQSSWGQGAFVKVSCPAIPGTLLESELFGHECGILTGAFAGRTGRVGMAMTGTLFLDEISELDSTLQSRLLQVLQNGQLQGTGPGTRGTKVNIRVICATNRRLQREVAAERFHQDLYYRITGLVLGLPPLRERLEDLEQLATYFVARYNERFQCSAPPLSETMLLQMATHPWTGNIRELENLIKRYVVVGTEEAILSEIAQRDAAAGSPAAPSPSFSLGQLTRNATQVMESRIILSALRANQWNRNRSLLYKVKKAGIHSRQVESA